MCVEARIVISLISLQMQIFVTSAKIRDIQHKTVEPKPWGHQDLRVIATTAKNMDIEHLNADQSLRGHLINLQEELIMYITTIGITTPSIAVTIAKSMDTLLKIA